MIDGRSDNDPISITNGLAESLTLTLFVNVWVVQGEIDSTEIDQCCRCARLVGGSQRMPERRPSVTPRATTTADSHDMYHVREYVSQSKRAPG